MVLAEFTVLLLQSTASGDPAGRLTEFINYNAAYASETLRGFRCRVVFNHQLEKVLHGKEPVHIVRSGEFNYTRQRDMQRIESLAELDGFPGVLKIVWLAFDGRQGYSLEGNPLHPFGLSYSTTLRLPPFNYESILPEWVMHGTYFGPLSLQLQYLNYQYLPDALQLTDRGITLQALAINGPKRPDNIETADQVWQFVFDNSQYPLLSEVRCYRKPTVPGDGAVALEVQGHTFWLGSSWEILDTTTVDRVPLPQRVRYRSYLWEPTEDSKFSNRYQQEILVEYRDWVTAPSLALEPGYFRISRPLGVPVLDPIERALAITDSTVVGISPEQLEYYYRLMDSFTPESEPDLTVGSTVEEAVESLSGGLQVNCAGISLLLFLRRIQSDVDSGLMSNFPIANDGSTSIRELIAFSKDLGQPLVATEVSYADLEPESEGIVFFMAADEDTDGHFANLISHDRQHWVVDPPLRPYLLLERAGERLVVITTPGRVPSGGTTGRLYLSILALLIAILAIVVLRRSGVRKE